MVLTPPFPIPREESAFHVSCAVYNKLSLPFLAPALCHGLCMPTAADQLWLGAEWVRRLPHSQPWKHQAETAFGHQNTQQHRDCLRGFTALSQTQINTIPLYLHQVGQPRHLELSGYFTGSGCGSKFPWRTLELISDTCDCIQSPARWIFFRQREKLSARLKRIHKHRTEFHLD